MIWVKRGKDFWSSQDGRFDKIRVVAQKEKKVRFAVKGNPKGNNRQGWTLSGNETTIQAEVYFVLYDWELGNSMKFRKESDSDEWVKDQLKKSTTPALTTKPKSA